MVSSKDAKVYGVEIVNNDGKTYHSIALIVTGM